MLKLNFSISTTASTLCSLSTAFTYSICILYDLMVKAPVAENVKFLHFTPSVSLITLTP